MGRSTVSEPEAVLASSSASGPGGAAIDVLTPGQQARRGRVLEAAMELAASGGYELVQMRAVAQRAGVAMGTIYRYFESKDQLLGAALVEWSDQLARGLEERPPRGDAPLDRLVDVIGRASRAMERNPQLTAALVTAVSSADPGVRQYQAAVAASVADILAAALTDVTQAQREALLRILLHVWFAALLGWVNGWWGVGSVGEELEFVARQFLGGTFEVEPG
jgi:TetR/AcrR family transcriptional regulator, cholesterol catabolism regulator